MKQALQDRLRALLSATSTMRETTQEVEEEASSSLSTVVISRPSSTTTHWAIAAVTDERSRQCRVFHVSDAHILGLRALGWTCLAQDEILDRSSSYQTGVRIGLAEKDGLDRLEQVRPLHRGHLAPLSERPPSSHTGITRDQAVCGDQLPLPTSDTWDCEDWTLAVIKYLEDQGFMLVTYGMDGGTLISQLVRDSLRAQSLTERHNSRPVFVPLSLPSIGH